MITDSVLHVWMVPLNPAFHERTKPMGADQLLDEMRAAGVERAVLVPPREFENDYALAEAEQHSGRFRVMPVIDPRREDLAPTVRRLAGLPLVVGFRVVMHTPELVAAFDAGAFDRFWVEAEAVGVPVAVFPAGAASRVRLVAERHPGLRLVVDHLGLPLRVTGARVMSDLAPVLALAALPNVAVKASGLPTHSEQPFPFADVAPALNALLAAFGPHRVFWGSDLTRLACPYREAVEMMPVVLPDAGVRELVMGAAFSRWIGWPAGESGSALGVVEN